MILCFCILAVATGAVSRPIFAQCANLTDAQVVADVYAKIAEDKGLASQVSHINVVPLVALSTVKLHGWTNNQSDYDKVRNIATSSNCFKVNVNDFEPAPPPEGDRMRAAPGGGCALGYKQCGDLCIPEGDACNIGGSRSMNGSIFTSDIVAGFEIFSSGSAMACR